MKRTGWMVGLFLCPFLLLAPAICVAGVAGKLVKSIGIKGAVRADKNTVRFYIHTKKGEPYNPKTAQEDIRRIYALGYFDDIQLDASDDNGGIALTFILKEKPFVRDIIITGMEEVEEKVALTKIKTKKGAFFRQDFIPWDESRIKRLYRNKGFYFTRIHTVVHKLGARQVDVEYKIDEGKKIVIGDVEFRGAKAFSAQTLRGRIETKPATWTSFMSDSGAYKKDVLRMDVLRLESFYNDSGFIKARVSDPMVEIDREKRRINITFSISEGERYRVGGIEAQGDTVYSSEEIISNLHLEKGDVFNRSVFRKDMFNITELYSRKGYAFANVTPQVKIDEKTKTVNVNIKTRKGPRVYVGRITITGNDKTRDRVIRREFLLQEGELFDSEKLRRTRTRINKLGFFESVDFKQKSRREEDLVDIEVKVVERQTGQFSFAIGYSSLENLVLQGQLRWSNLLGRGQLLALTLDSSSRRNDYSISFTEPALFDRKLSGGVDLYNREFEYDAFKSRNTGGSLRVGKGIGEYTWAKIGYKYEKNRVTILDTSTASAYLTSQEGDRVTGSVFPSLTYDTRNDAFNPTAGRRLYGYFEFAGVGGEEKFYKAIGEYTEYDALWLEFVGMLHAKIGKVENYTGGDVPVYERFFMGGPRSLRGFTIRNLGPLDENGEAIGGEALLQLNLELQYRFSRFFRGFLFYDRGNVYGSGDTQGNTTDKLYNLEEMRHSWGFGVHFFSPIGPISIAYGFKLDKREGETPSEFHFTIGGAF